ncbi:FAD binding domain protein [Synechococcus sp. PCC 7335]|uniref:FAD-binding oxidoreductase n=1 Tax=Synechococcus sp. (strain ATCC 29403 / PCC 7335) TaxID=91464 RepID=UPI00017EDFEE|nr:FAD-binding oxidoreductase [Synechococcus sp. PCC 7335]EDX86970.1 FAD binding domain protein [Synechococcus sp. PCC 7335]
MTASAYGSSQASSQADFASRYSNVRSIDWQQFARSLSPIETLLDPIQVGKLSKDYYYFSPVLVEQLGDKVGDLVLRPKNEAEVLRAAKACVDAKVPLTVRGAGTGNYGQAIPLVGGVILDLSAMTAVKSVAPGRACVEAGAKLAAIDRVTRPQGWEIRMAPSTYRTATIGGFVGGGSGGIGSVMYGQLADRGSVQAVRVVTMEDSPRVIELRGDAVQQVSHAYGTNGIITELEIPLGPAYPWAEMIVTFDEFMRAAWFGQALGDADGIIKKLISIHAWPIPSYFNALKDSLPDGKAAVLLIVSEADIEAVRALSKEWDGEITYEKDAQSASKGAAIAEFSWNHTTLHARNVDETLTYLQTVFPYDPDLTLLQHMYEHFGDEVMMHLEYVRSQGRIVPTALQLVRYTTPERLADIIRYHEEKGAFIANPHTYVLEDGGRKTIDENQLNFKEKVDPYGLLNPGKMRGWIERHAVQ